MATRKPSDSEICALLKLHPRELETMKRRNHGDVPTNVWLIARGKKEQIEADRIRKSGQSVTHTHRIRGTFYPH